MKINYKKIKRKIIVITLCILFITIVQAKVVGEQNENDAGQGGERSGGSGVSVNDGGRDSGKVDSRERDSHSGNGTDGNSRGNNSGPGQKAEKPIIVFNEITNPNLNHPLEGISSADRMDQGKVVEHIEIKTESKLEEAANNEQGHLISEALSKGPQEQNKNTEKLGSNRPEGSSKDGLESDAEEIKKLAQNAKNQAKRSEDKAQLDQLLKFSEKYAELQKNYNNMIENTANEINQKDSSELMSDTENYSEKNQTQPKIKEAMNSAPNQNASFKLANISKSISGLMNGVIGSVANSFMDFIKSIFDKKPIDGGPYVKESLRNALSNGQAKSQNPIDPVRNKLNSFAQSYLAPGIKIQYSQDRDKRNGPNSFDCSGFITFVYKQFGLEISKANGGAPLVSQIIDKTGLFYKLDDKNDAKVGDLIVHKGQIDNHVGIFSRKDENGNVKEISATVGGKFEKSKLDPNDPLFKSSITEYPASSFGKDWAVYRWNK